MSEIKMRTDLEHARVIAAADPDIWPEEAVEINLARDVLDLRTWVEDVLENNRCGFALDGELIARGQGLLQDSPVMQPPSEADDRG